MILRIAAVIFLLFSHTLTAQQWYNSPVYHNRNVYSVFPHSRTNIVAAGGNESNDSLQDIFKSYTGGMTWDFASNQGGGYIRSMDFSDSLNGLAVGYSGKILKSVDGGASWERVFLSGAMNQRNFTTVKYSSAQTVFAFGGRNYTSDTIQTIIKSTDGGETWNSIRDAAGRWLKGAHFVDANTVFAVGGRGTILKSIDGGNNWNTVTSPVTDREFNAVYFINSTTGFIAGGNFVQFDTLNSVRTLLKTTDGGDTWNVVFNEAGGWFTAIDFIDENTGYIVGDGSTLYKTIDGGNNWFSETVTGSAALSNFTSVNFLNENFGVVGAMFGEVFLYSNEPLPEVQTLDAGITSVTDTSVNVLFRANINTHGNPVTYNFVYSTVPDFSFNVGYSFQQIFPTPYNSNSLQLIEHSINTLITNTTYYYYVTINSINGTVNGDTLSFTTDAPFNLLVTANPQTNNPLFTVFSGIINEPSEPLTIYFEYGTTSQFGSEVQATPFLLQAPLNYNVYDTIYSLQLNTLYYYRLKAVSQTDTYYGNTVLFYTGNLYSDFEATEATGVTDTTAILNAVINNFRLPLTDITFVYGTNPGQLNNWINGLPAYINDTLQHAVSAPVSGLSPNTFYYYKIMGETITGQQTSNTASFYTGVLTLDFQALPATTVGENFATLNGFVSGFLSTQLPAEITFEYGITPSLGQTIQSTPFEITDSLSYNLSAFVTNISPGNVYYFRLSAQTQSGIVYSNLQSFATPFAGNFLSTLPAVNVTQTSARLKGKIFNISFPVTLSFEYGLTEDLGSEINAVPAAIDDTLYHEFSADLTGLITDTFYYFRVKANYSNENFYTTTRKVFIGEPEIPNWNFNNWESDTLSIPPQWNIAVDQNFEKVPGHSGGYALKITEFNFAILGFPEDGSESNNGPVFYGGCPFVSRPDSVIFFLNYFINPLDSGMFLINLYSGDSVIAKDFYFITGNSSENFQRFSFPVNYVSQLNPDSLVIGFTSANPFSTQLLDVSENRMIIDDVSFYPAASHSCNLDFENWINVPFPDLPGWYYIKAALVNTDDIQGSQRIVKVEGQEQGDFAVKIQNTNSFNLWHSFDLSNMKWKDFAGRKENGSPVSRRYERINGYYKYSCVPEDTVVIEAAMFKNSTIIGETKLYKSGTIDEFQVFDILINYQDETTVPDSAVLNFRTNNGGRSMAYASIVIDKVCFDGIYETVPDTTSAIAENLVSELSIMLYPNPGKETISVVADNLRENGLSYKIFDLSGRTIMQKEIQSGSANALKFEINSSALESGIYFLRFNNGKNYKTLKWIKS